jgi:hypothetical protein
MTQLSDNKSIEKKEKWVIEKSGEKVSFTRFLGDQVHESYAPVSQEVAGIYAAAIVQGFQPPRCLNYLDKITSCNQTGSELNKNTSPMCEVKFKHDLACFYGFTALDNFSRSQVGRIIEVLKREPELIELKADRLEAIATKVVSKARRAFD